MKSSEYIYLNIKYLFKLFILNIADVAQGFKPRTTLIRGRTRAEVMEHASGAMGGPPDVLWSSSEVEDWPGPPAVWWQWKG